MKHETLPRNHEPKHSATVALNISVAEPCSCAQFAPGCIFGHVNGALRICTGCKFASTLEVVQIYLHPGCKFAPGCKLCT